MSVIQSIRDRGAWIIFGIIALALIAFILQDGLGRKGSRLSTSSIITKVDGKVIERGAFEEKLKMAEAMYAQQGATRDQLIGSVWTQEVESIVLSNEYEKLGLVVSTKELNDILYGDNSPFRQEFTDPKTGEFKVDDVKRIVAQIKKSKNVEQNKMIIEGYINPAVQNALRTKYQTLLIQSAYVPKWLTEKQQADNNAIAAISYVYYPYQAIADSSVKVSDSEIEAYVKKHASEFKKTEETRSISFVTFSAAPSAADTSAVLNQLKTLKKDFQEATDPAAFIAKAGSQIPFYNSYFSKNKLKMAFKDSITKLPVGGVFGPYLDGGNYVYAKMIGIKQWPDSVKVRHILVATSNPQTGQEIKPDSIGKKLIDSIETAVKAGADFATLAAKYSDDPGSKAKGGVIDYFPQGQMVGAFNDYVFDKPVGTKGVVKTEYGYHFIEILGQKNINPAYKVAYLAKQIVASNETDNAASTAAAKFAVESKSAKSFNENAAKQNKQILVSGEIKANDFTIASLGQSRSLVRWVYEGKAGDVSDPTSINDMYVVALITAVNKAGLMGVTEARPFVEAIIRNQKKAKQIIDTKIKGNSLDEIAKNAGSPVLKADSLSFGASFIAGVGSEPKVVGAAFNKSTATKITPAIGGNSGVFVIKTESTGAKTDLAGPDAAKQGLLQSRKMGVYRSLEALRKAATIKDYRSNFY
ncbi:MAG: peptidylprolyl isomerase [Sediminibacterium sp.]|jgi:peptidyl-prolyl cis-trans isomerase D|nr:peptidylprolyl isomerase [Chitinophagaceae bacterium]MCA6446904.1 peptidylprolyl isomerase [Chitinophagaceae bacterium]